ncbi:MAG: beta-galactosidase [Anaerolineae bacterium]|nr:beta-galactosidase [Anaerolineae bacterium]
MVWALNPPHVLVVVGPPHEVHTTNPLVGVHTRLTDEVEAWKIQRTLQMVREMGAPWIVEYFPWAYIEPQQGRFEWEHADAVVAHARAQGLTVIARVGWTPGWARPDPGEQETTPTYLDAEHYADFAAFVAAFVARYRGQVTHVIIWNEPNLSFEWGYRPVDPAGYVEMLRAVYPAAHAANPDVVVLAGALAPTLEPQGSPAGLNDLIYLEQMYAAGAAPYFDALSAHAYGLGFPPEADPAADVINFRRTELLRAIMEAHGDAHKPIYVTEAGWNDHPRWARAVRPAQRITYTLGAYEWARQYWPWCPVVAMWAFRYPAPVHNYQDYYTFVTADFHPKPIYTEAQTYTGN